MSAPARLGPVATRLRVALVAVNGALACALLALVASSLASVPVADVPRYDPLRRSLGCLRPVDLFADHEKVARELDRPLRTPAPEAVEPSRSTPAADEPCEVFLVHLHPNDPRQHTALVRATGSVPIVIRAGERIPGTRFRCEAIGATTTNALVSPRVQLVVEQEGRR